MATWREPFRRLRQEFLDASTLYSDTCCCVASPAGDYPLSIDNMLAKGSPARTYQISRDEVAWVVGCAPAQDRFQVLISKANIALPADFDNRMAICGRGLAIEPRPIGKWIRFLYAALASPGSALIIDQRESNADLRFLGLDPFDASAFTIDHAILSVETEADAVKWTPPRAPSEWEKVMDLTWETIKKRMDEGHIRYQKFSTKRYSFAEDDLPGAGE